MKKAVHLELLNQLREAHAGQEYTTKTHTTTDAFSFPATTSRDVLGESLREGAQRMLSHFSPCIQPDGTIRMWLEGVRPSLCSGCNWITATITVTDGVGNVTYTGSDTVRFTVAKMHVESIDFGGDNHSIVRDTTAIAYPSPQWLDTDGDGWPNYVGEWPFPVAYTRNSSMVIDEVRFRFAPMDLAFQNVSCAAFVPGNSAECALVQDGCDLVATNMVFAPFGNTAQWWGVYPIGWIVTMNGQQIYPGMFDTWVPLYITLTDPVASPLYHTAVDVACRGANGLDGSNTETVIETIFARFQNLEVTRSTLENDGSAPILTYYHNWSIVSDLAATHIDYLLLEGDGQCGAWAKFFRHCLKVHNLHIGAEWIFALPSESNGFLVKNWGFQEPGSAGDPVYKYLTVPIPGEPPIVGAPGNQQHNWVDNEWHDPEAVEHWGIVGQGGTNPMSLFGNHQFVRIGAKYYDPSYGTIYTGPTDFQAQAIAGFVNLVTNMYPESTVGIDLDGDGAITGMMGMCNVMRHRTVPSATLLYFGTPEPWTD